MEVIGLLGHQGVGKNYIAEKILPSILEKKPTIILAFADHFKVDCICKHKLDYNKVYGKKDYETRRVLQKVGTEKGRIIFGDDIWIKTLETWMRILNERGIERFIISDVRFVNEVNWIKSIGGIVIKINAPERYMKRLLEEADGNNSKINEIKSHPSENKIDEIQNYDLCILNDPNDNPEVCLKQFFYQTIST